MTKAEPMPRWPNGMPLMAAEWPRWRVVRSTGAWWAVPPEGALDQFSRMFDKFPDALHYAMRAAYRKADQ